MVRYKVDGFLRRNGMDIKPRGSNYETMSVEELADQGDDRGSDRGKRNAGAEHHRGSRRAGAGQSINLRPEPL